MSLFRKVLSWYFSKQSLPYWCILILDSLIIFLSGVFVYWMFRRTMVLIDHRFEVIYTLLLYIGFGLISAKVFRTYSGIVRYSSFDDLLKVGYANALSMVLALLVTYILGKIGVDALSALSLTETIATFMMSVMWMWLERIIVKALYDVSFIDTRSKRVLIYGALNGGVGVAKYIRSLRPKRYVLEGFITRDKRAKHIQLLGKPVYHVDDNLAAIVKSKHIAVVLVAPSRINDFRNNQRVQDIFIEGGCKILLVLQGQELQVTDDQQQDENYEHVELKEVSVEDLLPRDEIKVDLMSVGSLLAARRVLITGSAGSIGSEIVRQVAAFYPEKMMLIDQAETPEHDIRLMMARDFPDVEAETVVTSICQEARMEHIFREFRPDYVFHAAAYKHVPMMEDNPSEAVLNNILGTKIIADLSVKYGVKKFVMISTDKAVNPTNVMGCSKRICEIYVQALNRKLHQDYDKTLPAGPHIVSHTQFVTTRFGNVLGSNGSVIPLFREQIRRGGPVTVTDERIVRYFMLIPEACKLVLEAGTKGNGGEIFVFDMGQPVKIADLAKRMIALSNAKNVEIKYTGLRDGEKLYEEVLNELENTKPTFHDKIRIAQVREYEYDDISREIDKLIEISTHYDNMATVKKMKEIVPEYKSNNSVYEVLDVKE